MTGEISQEEHDADGIARQISGDNFSSWYRERQAVENIRDGHPYFNGPGAVGPPHKHSPSKLLQCHRKSYYQHTNAPKESSGNADGIFWFGTKFEENIAVPYLQSLVADDPNRVVRNSMWIDVEVTTSAGEVTIRGETDPVFVNRDSEPVLLTEIKTKESVSGLEDPSPHHVAQAHAYMYGLTQKHDRRVTDAVLLYGARKSLEVEAFHITFDPWFWREKVLDWVGTQTEARRNADLPPATPEQDWECSFCDYRERCGKSDSLGENAGANGLVPLVEYPRDRVVEYIESRDRVGLTPTVAWHYPKLAEDYPVHDWECVACGNQRLWDGVGWDGNTDSPPICDSCPHETGGAELRGPLPNEQSLEHEA